MQVLTIGLIDSNTLWHRRARIIDISMKQAPTVIDAMASITAVELERVLREIIEDSNILEMDIREDGHNNSLYIILKDPIDLKLLQSLMPPERKNKYYLPIDLAVVKASINQLEAIIVTYEILATEVKVTDMSTQADKTVNIELTHRELMTIIKDKYSIKDIIHQLTPTKLLVILDTPRLFTDLIDLRAK